jgi:SAM-dependent methyltransferase
MVDKSKMPTEPDWWRNGGEIHGCESWDDRELLLRFCETHGLTEKSRMLEVGFGAMRAGTLFIELLDPGNYYGLDHDDEVLKLALTEIERAGLWDKPKTLAINQTFDLAHIPEGVEIDFAWAYSVLTHLRKDQLRPCIKAVMDRLAPDGVFYATYNESKGGYDPGPEHPWRENELYGVRYPGQVFINLARQLGVSVEFVCDAFVEKYHRTGRGNQQKMLCFRHRHEDRLETVR